MEELDFLIEYLLNEREENLDYKNKTEEEKYNLYRTYANLRDAGEKDISKDFIENEKNYLKSRLDKKGIVEIDSESQIDNRIYLWKGDITRLKVDAIVNAANASGLGCFIPNHNCIDNVIHTAAGIMLREECLTKMKKIRSLETAKVFITKGYNLPAKYVIHTVGPIITLKVMDKDKIALKNCYLNSLKLAEEKEVKQIAFPCISTGVFSFPKDEACKIAIDAVKTYFKEVKDSSIEKVIFNVFANDDYEIYSKELKK